MLTESNDEDNKLDNVVHQLNRLSVAEDLNKIHHEEISANSMKSVKPKPKVHVWYKLGNEWFKGMNLSG